MNMIKKVAIASALALTLSVSAQAAVTSGGYIESTKIVDVYTTTKTFSELITFTVAPNNGAGVLTSALVYKTVGATIKNAALYEGTFSSLASLNSAISNNSVSALWSSSNVVTSVDGNSTSTKITGDVGVLDYTKSYTLLVSGTGKGGVSAQITLLPAVPEPETYAMLLAGLGLMGAIARRKSKRAAPADMAAA